MIDRKKWEEFRSSGLLWWINRMLHLCGWAICVVVEADGSISDVYPARVKFRGFDEKSESEGFISLTQHIADNATDLVAEANS